MQEATNRIDPATLDAAHPAVKEIIDGAQRTSPEAVAAAHPAAAEVLHAAGVVAPGASEATAPESTQEAIDSTAKTYGPTDQ